METGAGETGGQRRQERVFYFIFYFSTRKYPPENRKEKKVHVKVAAKNKQITKKVAAPLQQRRFSTKHAPIISSVLGGRRIIGVLFLSA